MGGLTWHPSQHFTAMLSHSSYLQKEDKYELALQGDGTDWKTVGDLGVKRTGNPACVFMGKLCGADQLEACRQGSSTG